MVHGLHHFNRSTGVVIVKVGDDPAADLLAFPHIDNFSLFIMHIIDTRLVRKGIEHFTRKRGVISDLSLSVTLDQSLIVILQEDLEKLGRSERITGRTMSSMDLNSEGTTKLPQTVGGMAWDQFPACLYRAEGFSFVLITQAAKFRSDEIVIERAVVGNEYAIFGEVNDIPGHLKESGCMLHHLIGDACKLHNVIRNPALGIDQCLILINDTFSIVLVDGDLGDAIAPGVASGGLYVDNTVQIT